jgi:two-component system, NarL family, invasion response regulator UvrY
LSSLLLVDDHALFRESLATVLTGLGFRVVGQASDEAAALALMVESHPDVVLIDINLGRGGNGLRLLRQIRALGSAVPVVVVSMGVDASVARAAMREGASAYVLKDSPIEVLMTALQKAVLGGFFVDPSMDLANDLLSPIVDALSPRELDVWRRVALGSTSAAIAAELGLSPKTVETYRSRVMTKLGAHDVASLTRLAISLGIC